MKYLRSGTEQEKIEKNLKILMRCGTILIASQQKRAGKEIFEKLNLK
jgi:hypothetical protein